MSHVIKVSSALTCVHIYRGNHFPTSDVRFTFASDLTVELALASFFAAVASRWSHKQSSLATQVTSATE